MFGFRKKTPPPLRESNPGITVEGKVAFANDSGSWTETFNTVDLAASALQGRGYAIRQEQSWLVHPDSGFLLSPQLVELHPLDDGGVQTLTTVQTNHPELVPEGVFEYQHSTGDSVEDSMAKGFDQWVQTDFLPLLEALRPEPDQCMMLGMNFPARDGRPPRTRRAILGPVMHFMERPPVGGESERHPGDAPDGEDACEEHSFCPCCLLTRSFEAFKELIEGERFFGLRLFAARDEHGRPQADCRVNGDDWGPGAEALRQYASTWPDAGYEFRKQYVVLHNAKAQA